MKQKDLAEEHLIKAKENAIYFKDGKFPNMPLYQENDIKAAFNAGRESVVENMPELKFKKTYKGGHSFATTPFWLSYEIYLDFDEFGVFCDECLVVSCQSLKEAKQAANEDYQKRIKQALGL